MNANCLRLPPGTLWPAIRRQTEAAIGAGSLHTIDTEPHPVVQNGVRFVVRVVAVLTRKDEERQRRAVSVGDRAANPFLPYEQNLFVANVSDSHLCLLNKFNVIDHHLLIVTRRFAHQEQLLTRPDFEALCACLAEFPSLGFYNGGETAGASQPHKHLQLVPLPLAEDRHAVPIEPLFETARSARGVTTLAALPFVHAFATLEPADGADAVQAHYHEMLRAVGLRGIDRGGETRQSGPYNLLVTQRWMLMVPRSQEFFEGISINALGFAGSFFVRNEDQLHTLRMRGPMTALQGVVGTRP